MQKTKSSLFVFCDFEFIIGPTLFYHCDLPCFLLSAGCVNQIDVEARSHFVSGIVGEVPGSGGRVRAEGQRLHPVSRKGEDFYRAAQRQMIEGDRPRVLVAPPGVGEYP